MASSSSSQVFNSPAVSSTAAGIGGVASNYKGDRSNQTPSPNPNSAGNKYNHGRTNSIQQVINTVRKRSGSTAEIAEKLKVPISYELVGLCLIWYLSSAVTNTSSKSILNAFRQPVTLTIVQFAFVSIWCMVLSTAGKVSLTVNKWIPGIQGGLQTPSWEIFWMTAPLACFQVGGHITSSFATSRIPVSLVHTIKGLSPLFTVFAYRSFFGIQYSRATYMSLIPLTIGVMLACSIEFRGNFLGVVSAFTGALIFVTQNIFSKKIFTNSEQQDVGRVKTKKLDKLNLLCYSSGMAFLLTTPIWLFSEGGTLMHDFWATGSVKMTNRAGSLTGRELCYEFIFNGASHFGQNIIAFVLLSRVSPVTYSVASLVKRIFVIVIAIIWFGNKTTPIQAVGILLTFVGLWMYDRADVSRKEKKQLHAKSPILPLNIETKAHRQNAAVQFIDSILSPKSKISTSPRPYTNHTFATSAGGNADSAWLPGTRQQETWRARETAPGNKNLSNGLMT